MAEAKTEVVARMSIETRHLIDLLDGKKLIPEIDKKYRRAMAVNEFRAQLDAK